MSARRGRVRARRPGVRSPMPGRLHARRGAVTVMAGVFMVGFTMFAAMAIDASRVLSERAAVQTVADASALAGAIQMLRDSSVAADSAAAYARKNGFRTRGDMPDELETVTGVWSPSTQSFLPGSEPADAIRVRLRRRVTFAVAQMLGLSGVWLTAQSTAWSSAPVSASRGCVKPLLLPYSFMRRVVNSPSANITPDDMRHLRELTQAERTDSFAIGDQNTPSNDRYFPVTLPPVQRADGEDPESSQGTFEDYIGGCKSTKVAPGDRVRLLVASGGRRTAIIDGMSQLCQAPVDQGGMGGIFNQGACWVNGAAAGITLKVGFWDIPPSYDASGVGYADVKAVGSFVFEHIDDTNDPVSGQVRGTLRGYLTTQRDYGPIGTGASTLRRAVLVE